MKSSTLRVLFLVGAMFSGTGGRADITVVVNPKAPVSSLTTEQVAQIFTGRAGGYRLLDLPDGSPLRTEFYRMTTQKDAAQMKGLWAKLIFTGRAAPPKELVNSAQVKKVIGAEVNAMGYIDAKDLDPSVKVVLTIK